MSYTRMNTIESFSIAQTGSSKGSLKENLDALKGLLQKDTPCYLVVEDKDKKVILINYVPDNSMVNNPTKMHTFK